MHFDCRLSKDSSAFIVAKLETESNRLIKREKILALGIILISLSPDVLKPNDRRREAC